MHQNYSVEIVYQYTLDRKGFMKEDFTIDITSRIILFIVWISFNI